MNGRPSSYVCPSTVTWSSCMHSRSAACVFGEARLISSTSRRFANTGPGLNSNSFERWLKTFTPVTSEGSRSGVNWRRENDASSERASALASIVFPTPGKSSRIRCPSLTRQRTQRRSASAGAWTTAARLSTIRRIESAAASTSTGCLPVAVSSIPLSKQALGLVEDGGGDALLARLGNPPLAAGRDDHDLVLYGVEADVGSRHVVEDDEVGAFARALLACALEAVLAFVGGEADDHLAVTPPRGELAQHVPRRLERHLPRRGILRALAVSSLPRPVVRDRGGHQDEVGTASGERLAGHVLGGRSLDDLHPSGRLHREVGRDERHLRPAAAGLLGERDAHPAGRAVAEEADRVERLACTARGDEQAGAAGRRR